jgi:PAS domain S-box-containing protein
MAQINQPDFKKIFESAPGLYLILLPDLTIVAVSNSYANATMTKREEILGKGLFEVFPDNPDDVGATGVSNLRASLNIVKKEKKAHTMAIQKYDIRRPDGTFEERHWSPLNTAVLDENNEVIYIIHRVEDVTEMVKIKELEKQQKQKIKESTELIEQMRQLSEHLQNIREEERANIAREIHDELGQQMTAMKMDISWLLKK